MQKILLLKQTVSGITEYLDIGIYYFYHFQTLRKLRVLCISIINLLNKLWYVTLFIIENIPSVVTI